MYNIYTTKFCLQNKTLTVFLNPSLYTSAIPTIFLLKEVTKFYLLFPCFPLLDTDINLIWICKKFIYSVACGLDPYVNESYCGYFLQPAFFAQLYVCGIYSCW